MGLVKLGKLRNVDLMKVRCSTYATSMTFVALLALAIGFATSHWLESKTIPNQRFKRIGLWEACFHRLHDHHYRYDTVITGCRWIFDEDNSFMMDFLEPNLVKEDPNQVPTRSGLLSFSCTCCSIYEYNSQSSYQECTCSQVVVTHITELRNAIKDVAGSIPDRIKCV